VIAVYLEDSSLSGVDTTSIVSVLDRAFDAGIQHNVTLSKSLADVVVAVPVANFSSTDYTKAAQLIDAATRLRKRNRAICCATHSTTQDGTQFSPIASAAASRRPASCAWSAWKAANRAPAARFRPI